MHRIMRLIVMFDLPMVSSTDKKNYRQFQKFLIENGYAMVQFSVYAKIILNHSALQFQKVKLQQHLPPRGHIETLLITEKQFANKESYSNPVVRSEQVTSIERVIEL